MDELTFSSLFAGMMGWIAVTAMIALVLHHLLKNKTLPPSVWWLGLLISLLIFVPAPDGVVSQFGQLNWVGHYQSFAEVQVAPSGFTEMKSNFLYHYGLVIFLSGVAFVSIWRLARLYRNYQRLSQTVLHSIPVTSHVCEFPVYLTPFKDSAFVMGLFKPVIALPDYFFRLSSEQQLTVLAHEQTHIKLSDQRAKLLWRIVIETFWFNPFLSMLEKGFNQSMEHRCDRRTLTQYEFIPDEYARTLLQCLKLAGDTYSTNTVVGFSADGLVFKDYKRRMTLILDSAGHRFQYKIIGLLLAALASCIISINSAFAAFFTSQEHWIYPVANPRLTSGFGHIAKLRAYKPHQGIDLRGAKGTPIYASASGKVMIADSKSLPGGYGLVVVIQHQGGWQSLYAHLDDIGVSSGETVQQGEIIGTMGDTGKVSGVHLHFELAHEGNPVDPLELIIGHGEQKRVML